jgi:hypothetical protein
MNRLVILLFAIYFTTLSCNEVVKRETEESKRITEAKWMFYESNFHKPKTVCSKKGLKEFDINVCFIDSVSYVEQYVGDTMEIIVYPFIGEYKQCTAYDKGTCLNLFGFFPNVDTIAYRANEETKIDKRVLESDSMIISFAWMGINTRSAQKPLFREFIIKNRDKINPWLKNEAVKRGYING